MVQHYSHFTVSDNPTKFAGHEEQRQNQQNNDSDIIKMLVEQNSLQSQQIKELLQQNNKLMQKLVDNNSKA